MTSWRPALALAFAFSLVAAIALAGHAQPSPSKPSPASSADSPSVDSVIELVLARNPGLRSYRAHAVLDVRQVNFPYLHPILDGHLYYNSPGYTVYDFPHTPSYMKGFTKVVGPVGMPTRWRHCYNITLERSGNDYILHMVPKILGEVAEMDVTVNKTNGNPEFFHWTYHRPNDSVWLAQTFAVIGGYDVVTSQTSEITKHSVRAKASGSFDSFEYNVPVPTPTPTPSDPLHQCDN